MRATAVRGSFVRCGMVTATTFELVKDPGCLCPSANRFRPRSDSFDLTRGSSLSRCSPRGFSALLGLVVRLYCLEGHELHSLIKLIRKVALTDWNYAYASIHFVAVWFPIFLLGFVVALLLERRRPAAADQPLFGRGIRSDLPWVVVGPFLEAALVPAAIVAATQLFKRVHAPVLTWTERLPTVATIVISLLIFDLVHYWQHRFMHEVPFLWRFHSVHHSQTQLNFLSDYRFHPLDVALLVLVRTPIALFLGARLDTGLLVFLAVYALFIHANVRLTLGPLENVIVSPQFHRVHHGRERAFHDRNYATIFSFWDNLFGTRYPSIDEYPPTGIAGRNGQAYDGLRGIAVAMAAPIVGLPKTPSSIGAGTNAAGRQLDTRSAS